MKKIILVILIVGVIIGAGIAEQLFIDNTLTELENRSNEIFQLLLAEDYTSALTLTKETENWWSAKRDWLEFVCPNNDVKEIYREIGELKGSQLAQMYDDSITRSTVLNSMAKNSKNLLCYKWKNVL